jgi:hypothetical protein
VAIFETAAAEKGYTQTSHTPPSLCGAPLPSRVLTQEQRLAWTKELLRGEPDTLAYRVAGILLLLYAQPLTST